MSTSCSESTHHTLTHIHMHKHTLTPTLTQHVHPHMYPHTHTHTHMYVRMHMHPQVHSSSLTIHPKHIHSLGLVLVRTPGELLWLMAQENRTIDFQTLSNNQPDVTNCEWPNFLDCQHSTPNSFGYYELAS